MNNTRSRQQFDRARSPGWIVFLVVLLVGGAQTARAHQFPAGCSGVGLGITILPFRADGTTPLGSGSVSNCETLKFQTFVTYQGGTTCAFEGGSFTFTTPDGMV